MNDEKLNKIIPTDELNNVLPKYDPVKLSGKNLAQQYVSAFNTGMNVYQCINQLQGYIEWLINSVNTVVKSWNDSVDETLNMSIEIVKDTTTQQFNVMWEAKQPELTNQVNTLTTNQFNKEWSVLEDNINNTLNAQNSKIDLIKTDQRNRDVYVTPEMFGAIGDGVTDDTDAIQNAISSGHDVLLNSNKIYGVKKKLTISGNGINFPVISGGTIKALDDFIDDCILEIHALEPMKQLKIENITLDGNKLCEFAIKQLYGVNVYYSCIKTIGFTSIHFNILDGYETVLNHVYCRNNIEYNSEHPITGISFGATDSILTDCVTVNFDVGFYTDEELIFNECHPWCNSLDFLNTCIGFKVKSQCVFTNCSFDTLKYGLYVTDYYTQYLNGCRFIHNKNTEYTYIYLSYGVNVYVYNSKITRYTGIATITNKPESVYLYTCDIKGTYTNQYNNKTMFLNADNRYQLKFNSGSTLNINAGDSITKTFSVRGVKEFDILIVTPVYATEHFVYKAVPKTDGIDVTITNPTQSTLSISNYIYFNVVHITGNGNIPFKWTEIEANET